MASSEILLMRRAQREGDRWSGQIGLPGGHAEDFDEDLVATARRESRIVQAPITSKNERHRQTRFK